MIYLILIIMLIISISKPDVLLSKKIKVKASEEQNRILAKDLRKIYGFLIVAFVILRLITEYIDGIGGLICILIYVIIFLVLIFKILLPAKKEYSEITKGLK